MATLTALSLLLAFQTLSAPVEVPFKIGDEAIIVDVVANSRKLSLMFDTGFSGGLVVSPAISLGKPTGKITMRDFVGEFDAPTVKLTSFKLGSLDLPTDDVEAVQDRGGGSYSFSYNTHCDGILGYGGVSHQVLEINFQNSKFIFHPKSYDVTKRVPDGKTTFLAKLLPTGHNSIEMEVLTAAGRRMTLALDTGNAFFATTHRDVLERVGLWDPSREAKFTRSSYVASGEVASWYKRMKDLTIFGVQVPDSTWSIIEAASSTAESDGTIGFGFLKNFNLVLDFERRRVWMENWTGKVGNDAAADIGVTAVMDDSIKRVRVARVAPDSPADKAGIKRLDMVLSIDGQDELNVGFRRLNRMFEGEKGSKVKLVLSRNGNLMRFEVARDVLVND